MDTTDTLNAVQRNNFYCLIQFSTLLVQQHEMETTFTGGHTPFPLRGTQPFQQHRES